MRSALFILILPGFLSCNYEKYKDRVATGKGTYWDVYKVNGKVLKDSSYSYFCGVYGDCYLYSLKKSPDGSFKRYIDHGDGSAPNKWSMRSDTIRLRAVDYVIYSRSSKELKLIPVNKQNDTIELRESTTR